MKQEVKAFLDTVASRRAAQLMKMDPGCHASYALDDQMPRAVVKGEKDGKVTQFEFIETADTAAIPANMEDYVFAANEFGSLAVALPESNYNMSLAHTVLEDLRGRIRKSGATGEFAFNGYVYDGLGNFKRVK